mmetsp:Transcript_46543/g.61674  ORF Transcript_46543/g.61674 Transcript_46543/m.61674 type:complete len:87 (-) Transcript_46543:38-298(-)
MSLSSFFDHLQTRHENIILTSNFAEHEKESAELERRELESAYLVVRDETECPWCNKWLGFEKVRVFPHGMAFHMRCAKPTECPITK